MLFKKTFMALIMLSAACFAQADMMIQQGKDKLILHDRSCQSTVIQISEDMKPRVNDVTLVLEGVTYKGCWAQSGDDVFILYEDGDQARLPLSMFNKVLDAAV